MVEQRPQNGSPAYEYFSGVGNVKPPPPSKLGRYPPGRLIFDADFESGNLACVDEAVGISNNSDEYDLHIRADTCNPRQRVWFYFAASNALADQRVVFNVVNFSKIRSLFDSGAGSPVYRRGPSEAWNRLSLDDQHYFKSQSHDSHLILSFSHVFASSKERCEFAYCIPYTYTHLQKYLLSVEKRRLPHFKREKLTSSVQRRRIDLLTIASPENLHGPQKRVVFLMARVHPGETPSSWVLEGLLDFLLSDNPRAVRVRSLYTFKVVPMLNPDGVYLGNYRCSLMGVDLNRQWQQPSAWAHPSVAATKSLLLQYNSNPHYELVMCLDLHAHSQQTNSFLYGNLVTTGSEQSPRHGERQLIIPYLLADSTEDFSLRLTQFNIDAGKAGTSRRTMGEILNPNCLCYTLESSFFSYRPKDDLHAEAVPYLEDGYKLLGRNLALAILSYADVQSGEREVEIMRPFESFLSKRCLKAIQKDTEPLPPALAKIVGEIRTICNDGRPLSKPQWKITAGCNATMQILDSEADEVAEEASVGRFLWTRNRSVGGEKIGKVIDKLLSSLKKTTNEAGRLNQNVERLKEKMYALHDDKLRESGGTLDLGEFGAMKSEQDIGVKAYEALVEYSLGTMRRSKLEASMWEMEAELQRCIIFALISTRLEVHADKAEISFRIRLAKRCDLRSETNKLRAELFREKAAVETKMLTIEKKIQQLLATGVKLQAKLGKTRKQ